MSERPGDDEEGLLAQAIENCAREQIHIPGSIQPSGVLLAFSPADGLIRTASGNVAQLFGVTAAAMLGLPLDGFIEPGQIDILRRVPASDWRATRIVTLSLRLHGRIAQHDALVYRDGDLMVLELETLPTDNGNLFHSLFIPIRDALWKLDAESDLGRYCQAVTEQVRQLTGYDQVLMYRFDPNWDGVVIAEARDGRSPSYLGNRFPATDIPPQARALYTRNLVRLLADRTAEPVPLLGEAPGRDGRPLDMTFSALRSMSPVHLEYLRNMGVRATLTISLLHNEQLWGLIACHHRSPKLMSLRQRELHEFIGSTISLRLANLDSVERNAFGLQVRALLESLSAEIHRSGHVGQVLQDQGEALLGLVRAGGAVVAIAGGRYAIGATPSPEQVEALVMSLRRQDGGRVLCSEHLATLHAPAAAYEDVASGLLLARLDASMSGFIMWFRPAVVKTVNWAGQPNKVMLAGSGSPRVSPRKSFGVWVETYRDRSQSWSPVEVDAANALALAIIDVLSQRAIASSEESYRLLAEHSTDLIARLAHDGTLIYVSPACESLFGGAPESLVGHGLERFLLVEDAPAWREALQRVYRDGGCDPLLVRSRGTGVRRRWIEVSFKRMDYVDKPGQIIINARDVTQRHLYQLAIEDLHRRNVTILESVADGLVSLDRDGRVLFANEQAGRLLGRSSVELQGMSAGDLLCGAPGARSAGECRFLEALREGGGHPGVGRVFPLVDGREVTLDYTISTLQEEGALSGRVLMLRTSDSTLPLASDTSEVFLESAMEALMITDSEGRIVNVNRAFTEITGYCQDEALGHTPRLIKSGIHTPDFYRKLWETLAATGKWSGEIWNRRKNGEIYPQLGNITLIPDADGGVKNYVAVFHDISKAKQAEEKMYFMANHDALTRLPNRVLLGEMLNRAIDRAERKGGKLAVLFIDIDRFKIINDTLGHLAGDTFLLGITQRLARMIRKDESLARWGGDEFVLVMEADSAPAGVAVLVERLLVGLNQPMDVHGHELTPTASVGISIYPDDGRLANDLIRAADTAMYEAKENGRNGYRFYVEQMAREVSRKFGLNAELRRALRDGEFRLHYQPQIAAADGRLVGVEALLRWQHPERGLLAPGEFILLAEELGLIERIGTWVLQESCRQMRAWWNAGVRIPRVAINLAPPQFNQAFVEEIARMLADQKLPAGCLEIEITEGALGRGEDVLAVMRALRTLGVELSVDDFGTGYSSLAHLKTFPISCFKIDKSFVDGIPGSRQDEAIIRTILALGSSLDNLVVAEGVETREQFEFLRAAGVDVIQGYYFSRALPPEDYTADMQFPPPAP